MEQPINSRIQTLIEKGYEGPVKKLSGTGLWYMRRYLSVTKGAFMYYKNKPPENENVSVLNYKEKRPKGVINAYSAEFCVIPPKPGKRFGKQYQFQITAPHTEKPGRVVKWVFAVDN
jgi:hypothetical protein